MRLRNLLLLVLAVVLAAGTAMLARSYLAAQRAAQIVRATPPPARPERSILVARANINRGDLIKAGDLAWQVWPDNAIAPGYIVRGGKEAPETFAGWVAMDAIGNGAPILKNALISPGSGGFLAAVLKPGMKALQVPPAVLPNGTQPGDRVDMMVSFKPGGGWNGGNAVVTVLRGLRILRIVGFQLEAGKQSEPRSQGAAPIVFEVTPRQAEVITLAERMGTLSFILDSLRRDNHETAANTSAVTLAAAVSPQPDPADPPAAADDTATRTVDGKGRVDAADGAQPSYLTDAEINPMFLSRSWDAKTAVTVLRGSKPDKANSREEDVAVSLKCTETACTQSGQMPAKLVATGELPGVK